MNTISYISKVFPLSIERNSNRWLGIKIHFLSILLIISIAYLAKSPVLTLSSGGIISFITYLYIGFLETKRTPVWFSPLSFYFFWHSVTLGLSAIYFGILLSAEERIIFSTATVNYESLMKGYLIFLLGSFFLHAGLQKFRPDYKKRESNSEPQIRFSFKTIFVLIIISLLYLNYNQYFSVFGGLINFLNYGLIAAVSIFALTPPAKLRISGDLHKILIVAGCIGIFLLNISTTSKAFMMFSFLPLFWYLIMDRKKLKYLIMLVLLAIPFYLFIIYPVSFELRGQYWSGEGIDKTKAFSRVLQEDKGSLRRYGMEDDPVTAYLSRSFDPIAVAYLNQQVELYGYLGGETLEYISYAFIPRIFWPDKPTVTQGAWFAYYTGFASSPEKSTVSLGITATGELFWNFGIAGVAVGMFIIGSLFGGLWRMAGNDPRKSVISMLLYISIIFFMPAMSEAVTVLVGTVIYFLAFKTLFKLRELFFKKRFF